MVACEIAFGNDHYNRHYNHSNEHYNDSKYCDYFMDTGLLLRLSLMLEIHPSFKHSEQGKYYLNESHLKCFNLYNLHYIIKKEEFN